MMEKKEESRWKLKAISSKYIHPAPEHHICQTHGFFFLAVHKTAFCKGCEDVSHKAKRQTWPKPHIKHNSLDIHKHETDLLELF